MGTRSPAGALDPIGYTGAAGTRGPGRDTEEVAVFEFRVATDAERTVLVATGEFDVANAAALRHALFAQVRSGTPSVALDASGVTFFDSSGLGALIEGWQVADEIGVSFRVVRPSSHVQQRLRQAGLYDVLVGSETAPS